MSYLWLSATAVVTAASLQAATGFGFTLVLGPTLFAILEPSEAVGTMLALEIVLALLMLFGEGRRRDIAYLELLPIMAIAIPGLALGLYVLNTLPRAGIQIALGVSVLMAVALQAANSRSARAGGRRPPRLPGAAGIGLITGVLTTATTVNGPPVLLWLSARGLDRSALRDSLTALFLVTSLLGAAAVAAFGDGDGAALPLGAIGILAPFVVVGHLAGKRLFRRLGEDSYRLIALALSALAGLVSLAAGLSGL